MPVLITDTASRARLRDATLRSDADIYIDGLAPATITYQAASDGHFAEGITIWSGFGDDYFDVDTKGCGFHKMVCKALGHIVDDEWEEASALVREMEAICG